MCRAIRSSAIIILNHLSLTLKHASMVSTAFVRGYSKGGWVGGWVGGVSTELVTRVGR